jgi:hypothetical protein
MATLYATSVVAFIPIEELIADRLGQYVATTSLRLDMLDQAVTLYEIGNAVLEGGIHKGYLDKRIGEETSGTLSLTFLESKLQ